MLVLKIPARQVWDPNREEFLYIRETTLRLEHSLLSLAKWESKWHIPFFSSGGTSLILLLAEMGVMVNIGRNGERARLEREEAHAERERQRKAKTIVLDTARRAQTEQ